MLDALGLMGTGSLMCSRRTRFFGTGPGVRQGKNGDEALDCRIQEELNGLRTTSIPVREETCKGVGGLLRPTGVVFERMVSRMGKNWQIGLVHYSLKAPPPFENDLEVFETIGRPFSSVQFRRELTLCSMR